MWCLGHLSTSGSKRVPTIIMDSFLSQNYNILCITQYDALLSTQIDKSLYLLRELFYIIAFFASPNAKGPRLPKPFGVHMLALLIFYLDLVPFPSIPLFTLLEWECLPASLHVRSV